MSAPGINGFNPQIYTGAPQEMDGAHNVDESNQVEDKALQEWMEGKVNEYDVVENLKDQKFEGPGELHQAEAKPCVDPALAQRVKAQCVKRSAFCDFFKSIGRAIMEACHSVKCYFMPKYNAPSLEQIRFNATGRQGSGFKHVGPAKMGDVSTIQKQIDNASSENKKITLLKKLAEAKAFIAEETKPLEYDNKLVGTALGLKGPFTEKPFGAIVQTRNGEVEESDRAPKNFAELCPKGFARIEDIKQDPSLQDCWFLSSINAVLLSQGPDAIKELVTIPENQPKGQECAHVRMGHHVYKVPLSEIRGDNGKSPSVSQSAPWVQLLERAMQMHMIKMGEEHIPNIGKKGMGLALHSADIGLVALMGGKYHDDPCSDARLGVTPTLAEVKEMIDKHQPVVLGHQTILNGISPGHAVALVDIDTENNIVTVVDPYGHATNVPADEFGSQFIVYTYDFSKRPEEVLDNDGFEIEVGGSMPEASKVNEEIDDNEGFDVEKEATKIDTDSDKIEQPQADKVEQPENDKGSQEISGMFGDAEVID